MDKRDQAKQRVDVARNREDKKQGAVVIVKEDIPAPNPPDDDVL